MPSWETIWTIVWPILKVLLILVIGHFLIVYILKLMNKGLKKSPMDQSLARFLRKALNILLHILLLISALNSLGVSTGGIVAALSAAAVAVTVALKDSLSNVAGGILLLLSPRFSTGDYISAGGSGGTVHSVDLLHTTIITPDRRRISIPYGVLINDHIINYSEEAERRLELTFRIPYQADVQQAKEIALAVIAQHPMVKTEPEEPFVRVSGYEASAVTLTVRVWCTNKDYWTLNHDLLEQVRDAFAKAGMDLPYQQLDVHIRKED